MKKLIAFLLLTGLLLAADGTLTEGARPTRESTGYVSYSTLATFDILDTLTTGIFQMTGRDRDVSWNTFPFYCDLQVDAVGAPTAVSLTIYLLGGFDVVDIPCDTISISSIAQDSTLYTTFNLNDKKYPNYKMQLMADSCVVDFQFY